MRDLDRLFALGLMAAGAVLWSARRHGGWTVSGALVLLTLLLAGGIARLVWEIAAWNR